MLVLMAVGRALDSLPKDLAAAIEAGKVPGSIVRRYFELEKSPIFRWLLQFGGFKERLLADDLFLAKTAAELERRREKFTKELDFVFADVVMAIIADFMLVWLPAPTVSLRPALAVSAGSLAKFFYGCPDNAFQVALAGTSYSFLQRVGAIVRNGAKLFAVGTGASLVGTGITNGLINARKAIDKTFAGEAEDVPILSTSVAYGVYMAVSSNLRGGRVVRKHEYTGTFSGYLVLWYNTAQNSAKILTQGSKPRPETKRRRWRWSLGSHATGSVLLLPNQSLLAGFGVGGEGESVGERFCMLADVALVHWMTGNYWFTG
ncbi:hypothetical protein RHSIM_Rhsim01G0126800 [Rhododendron simsii]|uniref:Uncharacterized protein n=1 Tax=Rhododendron simsii TaxID=118357 RepID=A0A834HL68_RHOSS|nr:hypothetical protein RHSIM_Rhsim01G0126800 [Rhododendron simsii]